MIPAAPLAAPGDQVVQPLGRHLDGGEAFFADPLQQAVQEGARAGTTRKAMQILAAGRLTGFVRGEPIIVEQLLGRGGIQVQLQVELAFLPRLAQARADAQGTVGGDPPVLAGRATGRQRLEGHGRLARLRQPRGTGFGQRQDKGVGLRADQGRQGSTHGRRTRQGLATGSQITQGAASEAGVLAAAALEIGDPDPAGMPGPGQGDIEQPQVLGQALVVSAGQFLGGGFEGASQLALVVVIAQWQAGALLGAIGAGEGQEHQRVFQSLGLVHRHHLDQLGVAFQPQDLLVGSALGSQLLGQVADQRLFAVQFASGALQQFGKVQQVGQYPLAIGTGHQPLRQPEVLQQAAQHG